MFWLFTGKARFKDRLAREVELNVELLPYNRHLVEYLREQSSKGRHIVLATASSYRVAQAIADHLGIFDDVVASDRTTNLSGAAKASRLEESFGRGNFAYAGNDKKDLPVWQVAGTAILVTTADDVRRKVSVPVETSFPRSNKRLRDFLKAIRVYQWVKNLLVFLPAVGANALFQPGTFLSASAAFVCFSLTASGVYLLNDLANLEADRRHHRKHTRPFPSGAIPLEWGLIWGPGLIAFAIALAVTVSPALAGALLLYVILTSAYSAVLKTKPLVDVFTLAGLYMLRVFAGGAVTGHQLSVWLLSFSGFLFLSLAFLKRFIEIKGVSSDSDRELSRRGYFVSEEPALAALGIGSSFASALVLALYVDTSTAELIYHTPQTIWGLVPLALFWQCRMWLSATRGYVQDDPIVYAAKDWVSWLVAAMAIVLYLLGIANSSVS
jgi:4-hydroxybenzoate polyprenyltransferase